MAVGLCLIYDKNLLVETRLMRLVKQIKGAETVNEYLGSTLRSKSHISWSAFKHHDTTSKLVFPAQITQTRTIFSFELVLP